jgi:hypothetical protein
MGLRGQLHRAYLRHVVDHQTVRRIGLELLARPRKGAAPVHLSGGDVPPDLRALGSRCFVQVYADRVVVDLGSDWVDAYGFTVTTDQRTDADALSPGVFWWDAG